MNKNVIIDRLRGFCVLAVVCMHFTFYFPNVLLFLGHSLWNGYYGVTAFFCTSGFLITTNILRRYGQVAKVDAYAFYVMRFGRIAPPLLLLLVVLSFLSRTELPPFRMPAPMALGPALLNALTFRYNVYYRHGGALLPAWSVLWSLSIEEVFYLGYPLTAKVARTTRWLVGVLIVIAIGCVVHRRGNFAALYDYFGCFDGIALGALAALAVPRFKARITRPVAWAIMLAGVATVVSTYLRVDVNTYFERGLPLIAAGTALILFASQCQPFADTRPSSYDPFVYVGRLSYELYLFHLAVFGLLGSVVVPKYPGLAFGVAILCAVAVCDVINHFYAEPLNRWLRTVLLTARRPPAAGPLAPPSPSFATGNAGG